MASLNKVFLMGNLTRDPEVRYLSSGVPVCDMRLAISRKFRTKAGEDREDVCYVDVAAWDRTAENCGKYLAKGSPLHVEGRLQYDEWEKDGQKHSKLRVHAERVQFIGAPRQGAGEFKDVEEGKAAGASPSRGSEVRAPEPRVAGARAPEPRAAAVESAEDEDNLPF
jgi:single-strand DNA-binding protein